MSTQPAGHRLLDAAALLKIGRLSLESRQPMQGSVAGKHKSPHRGSSVEFAEYREYMPGDDLRRLDWRAYARSDRFYIKEFEADTNLRLCLVVDGSGSMRYGATSNAGNGDSTLSKFEYASRLAAMLGFVAIRQGDAAGLTVASSGGDKHLPPNRRPSHLSLLQDVLESVEPAGETNLIQALHDIAEKARQRAMVVILSDLFCEPDALAECFQHLKFRKHDAIAFHILERRELEFEFDRTTRFVDLEGGAPVVAEPSMMGRHYRAALASYLEGLADGVRKADIDYQRALLDEPPEDVLARFLLGRQQRRGRA
ncbi:MAG: DUF58 domain-containing protein [Planctomycetota bacterium]|nr:DUF58 domain-containing protein [Planctomycetota bacterium]